MLQLPRTEGEGFVQYQKRSAKVARNLLTSYGIEPISVRVLKAKHGWAMWLARLLLPPWGACSAFARSRGGKKL
eukprot:7288469-Heterocapsa_arctica.AAC.1